MGRAYEGQRRLEEAERAYHQACGEAPNTREPWCALALLMYMQHRWEESFAFAMRALKIKDRELVYTCDPAVWGAQPHDLASIAAWHLGLKDIALEQAKLAVEKEPNDIRLQSNLKWIQDAINGKKIVDEAA
jgi:tetratricopeptide (TPR) repeat protein